MQVWRIHACIQKSGKGGFAMSRYSLNEDELRKGQQLLLHVGNKLDAMIQNIENSRVSLEGYTGYGIERQRYTLESQKAALTLQIGNVEQLRTCIQQIIDRTATATQAAKAELEDSKLDTGFKTAADIFAAEQAKKELEEKKRREEEERKQAQQQAQANKGQGNAGASQGMNGVNPEQVKADMENRYQILRQRRGYSFQGRCGAFTYQQLAYENVVGDGDGIAYGQDYYRVWTQRGRTRTGYFVEGHPGSNGLRDLIQAHNNEPLTNVVISFDRGPHYPYEGGHVLLIHRIENGMVYYMDNNQSEGTAMHISVDEFMSKYPDANGALFFYR